MNIYNKKNFGYGLFMAILGVVLFALDIADGFEWKENIISALCLFLGMVLIVRSLSGKMSKADKLEEMDERNQLVLLKNRSSAFQIHRFLCLGLTAVFLALCKIAASEMFLYIGVGFGFAFAVSLFVDIFTFIYYDSRS